MREMAPETVTAALAALDGLSAHGLTVTSLVLDDCTSDCLVLLWGRTPIQPAEEEDSDGGMGEDEEQVEGNHENGGISSANLSVDVNCGQETEEGKEREEEEDEEEEAEEQEEGEERQGGGSEINKQDANGQGREIRIHVPQEGNGVPLGYEMTGDGERPAGSGSSANLLSEQDHRDGGGPHGSDRSTHSSGEEPSPADSGSSSDACIGSPLSASLTKRHGGEASGEQTPPQDTQVVSCQKSFSLPGLWSGRLTKFSTNSFQLPAHPLTLFGRCSNLQTLRLRSDAVDGDQLLAILRSLPRLKELALTEWSMDECFQAEVRRGEYQHGAEPVLCAISRLAYLTHLDLTESVFPSSLLRLLLPLSGLQALILHQTLVTEAEGMAEFEAELRLILQLTSLTCLHLSLPDDLMPDTFLHQLSTSLPGLRSVRLSLDTEDSFASLAAVTTLTSLAVWSGLNPTNAQLAMLQQPPGLESLDLSGDSFGCLNALTVLTRLTSLRLDLEGAELKTEDGVLLSRMTGLERLCLPSVRFQRGSLVESCSAMSQLTCLEVPSSFVNDEDLIEFARLPALRALNLELCRGVSEGGVRGFVRERQRDGFPRMAGIDVRGTRLPPSCVPSRLLHYFAVEQSCFDQKNIS